MYLSGATMFGLIWLGTTAFAAGCPVGQLEAGPAGDVCCWPGQVVHDGGCVGIPRCPDGTRTLPDRCVPSEVPLSAESRNVMFAGSEYSGQLLFIDGEERGRLPNAFTLPSGVHHWSVRNTLQQVLLEGEVKVRVGDDNQVVMVEAPVAE